MALLVPFTQSFSLAVPMCDLLQEGEVVNEFLQMWFEKLDCISQPERRKVSALAIASLLPFTARSVHSTQRQGSA